uniref:3-hydroxyisobutyryl-CoA hydrolase n=1 Tax=Solanum tuberosum TaxID=4113 RepID=M1CEG8_SOLTU
MFPMPQQVLRQNREVVMAEEIGRARMLTLNRPNHLNYLSGKVASTLGHNFEKYENDDNADFVIIKKPHIALVHGMSVGGGASLMAPMKFSVVTEKAFSSTPETNIGFHPDCGFSYMLPRLPGRLGEYLGLTGEKLKGKEVVAAGLATHFVPSQGIRAQIIDKDKSPKWNPSTLDKVHDDQLDLIFKPFEDHDLELQIPIKEEEEESRWRGKYENSSYSSPNQVNIQKAFRSMSSRESVLV